MFAATAVYDTDNREWTIEMYGLRICGAVDEATARATALALSEMRA